ncbi:mechanosensitive ion channel family protein [Maribellus sp. CM-23]|nr:mechanosensitive ion channel family protein [Maribellus sp. CM-23]
MNQFNEFITHHIGLNTETFSKVVVSVLIIIFLSALRLLILKLVWRRTEDVKVRYQWKRSLSMTLPFIGLLMIAAVWIKAFEEFGTFLGLFTAGIAIALKDPLTNLAGWLFIIFRKPFGVGDRVQIADNVGDVIDIRLFQFTILEIGNWVEADQSTGRIVHIPNGKVFLEPQANYSAGFEYIWNEIKVNITFESNWEKAKTILEEIINELEEGIPEKAKKEILEASKNYMIYYKHLTPIVYTSVKEFGVRLTIRYLCHPRTRRGSENQIWQRILTAFGSEKDIHFAYPTTRFFTSGENSPSK